MGRAGPATGQGPLPASISWQAPQPFRWAQPPLAQLPTAPNNQPPLPPQRGNCHHAVTPTQLPILPPLPPPSTCARGGGRTRAAHPLLHKPVAVPWPGQQCRCRPVVSQQQDTALPPCIAPHPLPGRCLEPLLLTQLASGCCLSPGASLRIPHKPMNQAPPCQLHPLHRTSFVSQQQGNMALVAQHRLLRCRAPHSWPRHTSQPTCRAPPATALALCCRPHHPVMLCGPRS